MMNRRTLFASAAALAAAAAAPAFASGSRAIELVGDVGEHPRMDVVIDWIQDCLESGVMKARSGDYYITYAVKLERPHFTVYQFGDAVGSSLMGSPFPGMPGIAVDVSDGGVPIGMAQLAVYPLSQDRPYFYVRPPLIDTETQPGRYVADRLGKRLGYDMSWMEPLKKLPRAQRVIAMNSTYGRLGVKKW